MRPPDGMNWSYPGFPSLVVPYLASSDFFFSGHMGVVTFLCLENLERSDYIMTIVSGLSIAVEFTVMVILRGHYTIDLITGVIVAHYLWIMTAKPAKLLDRRLGYATLQKLAAKV